MGPFYDKIMREFIQVLSFLIDSIIFCTIY